jgi:uncharacterized membrane protein SirB2
MRYIKALSQHMIVGLKIKLQEISMNIASIRAVIRNRNIQNKKYICNFEEVTDLILLLKGIGLRK